MQPQFILLRLARLCIVKSITFAKPPRASIGAIKDFSVYGGAEIDSLQPLLVGVMKQEEDIEPFPLRHILSPEEGIVQPIRYIKIVPSSTWSNHSLFNI